MTLKSTFFGGRNTEVADLFDDILGTVVGASFTNYNVLESEDDFKLEIYLPGVKKSDFKIDYEDDAFIISYESGESEEPEGYTYHKRGYKPYSFTKTFRLPKTVDVESINASYKEGILVVTFPKTEDGKKKSFTVEVK